MSNLAQTISHTSLVVAVAALAVVAAQPAQAQSANTDFLRDLRRYRQWRQPRRSRRCRQLLPDAGTGHGRRRQNLARLSLGASRRRQARGECARPHRQGTLAEFQRRRDRKRCRRTGANGLTKQTALSEKGEIINGRGDTPNRHDVLTGSQADGTAFAAGEDRTCKNWTSSTQGAAMVGTFPTVSGCVTMTPRNPGTARTPRAARAAAVRRPT